MLLEEIIKIGNRSSFDISIIEITGEFFKHVVCRLNPLKVIKFYIELCDRFPRCGRKVGDGGLKGLSMAQKVKTFVCTRFQLLGIRLLKLRFHIKQNRTDAYHFWKFITFGTYIPTTKEECSDYVYNSKANSENRRFLYVSVFFFSISFEWGRGWKGIEIPSDY
nr:hypothetical protein Iba_chr01aCG21820 [Ipomoea batatas]GME16918.1 hypothetical protein Iba_scaffold18056CG0070 [Ipomoea batatas]